MRVTINIPDELHAWLKARAKAEDTTMRVIILQAIDEILRTKEAVKKNVRRSFDSATLRSGGQSVS
jgi:predicted transcriptional regulator